MEVLTEIRPSVQRFGRTVRGCPIRPRSGLYAFFDIPKPLREVGGTRSCRWRMDLRLPHAGQLEQTLSEATDSSGGLLQPSGVKNWREWAGGWLPSGLGI